MADYPAKRFDLFHRSDLDNKYLFKNAFDLGWQTRTITNDEDGAYDLLPIGSISADITELLNDMK